MIDGETSAYLCGMAAGVIVGAAAMYALLRGVSKNAREVASENDRLRVLLNNLQLAEGGYRREADLNGENSQVTVAAWDRMRAAGNAARKHLLMRDAQG